MAGGSDDKERHFTPHLITFVLRQFEIWFESHDIALISLRGLTANTRTISLAT